MSRCVIYKHHSPLNCAVEFNYLKEKYIAIGTYTGEAIILHKNSEEEIVYFATWKLHQNAIKGLTCNQENLFSVSATGAVAIHAFHNGKEIVTIKNAHDKIVNGCVALDNQSYASISRDLTLRIWDGTNLLLLASIQSPHTHSIKCVATNADYRYIATGSYNGVVAILDRVKAAWEIRKLTTSGISSLCYDNKNKIFLASAYDGNVYAIKNGK